MANKIISLLKYDALHSTLSDEGEKEAQIFTWDRVADQTMQVYEGVL